MTETNRIDSSSIFLVSGGARGITAQCTVKLAQHYQCKFILLGRTSIAEPEPAWAKDCFDEPELKKRIIESLTAKGEPPEPLRVQTIFNAIFAQREVKRTLQAVAQAGSQAEYISVDVTNGADLQQKLQTVVQSIGPVTGIIHGAGNLADKLIEKKSAQDFDTVFSAKVTGLQNLLDCVSANQLDYLVMFSSAAGFYGNIGQTDYAMANEVLNKIAYLVKRNHPDCRVVSINWGPWDSGMVTPELKQVFAQRNIDVIPINVGTQLLVDELQSRDHNTVQIVVGSPFVPRSSKVDPALRTYRIRRTLTEASNPFLQDHVIGGHAVLPGACTIAWIANSCEQLYPGYQFFSYENSKILKGIVFDETLASEYILDLKEIAKTDSGEIAFEATISSKSEEGQVRYHHSIQVTLWRQLPQPPAYPFTSMPDQTTGRPALSFYQDGTLFHGPAFQGIQRVLEISPDRLTLACKLPHLDEQRQGQFPVQTVNPYIADVQFQSMVIWARHYYQAGCLPCAAKKGEQFKAIPFDEPFYVSMEVQSSTENNLVADITAHDAQGQIYNHVLGIEVVISKGLNHLFLKEEK